MTPLCHILPSADRDLDSQAGYLMQEASLETALRFYNAAGATIEKLARMPGMGELGTDQRLGVSFDQQDGSALGGWTGYGVIGVYARTARHAVKCAEWCRTHNVAWRSSPRTGRAGFRLR